MKVNIVLNQANKSWILEKISYKLSEEIKALGHQSVVSDSLVEDCDVVHHMSWAFANHVSKKPSTMFITHLDDAFKLQQVKSTLSHYVRAGICMSSDTMNQLLVSGCKQESLCFIGPAHDGLVTPRKIVIGITSRLYPDGRKREAILVELSKRMNLSAFEFKIFGNGWSDVIVRLQAAGAKVTYFKESDFFQEDYKNILEQIPYFDFYLYLGLDEGSLGTLDALAAGVPTIITPQGFHVDIPNGITYSVVTTENLMDILSRIENEKLCRIRSVQNNTWKAYGEKHIMLWDFLINKNDIPAELQSCHQKADAEAERIRHSQIQKNTLSIRRGLAALSHKPGFRSIRHFFSKK